MREGAQPPESLPGLALSLKARLRKPPRSGRAERLSSESIPAARPRPPSDAAATSVRSAPAPGSIAPASGPPCPATGRSCSALRTPPLPRGSSVGTPQGKGCLSRAIVLAGPTRAMPGVSPRDPPSISSWGGGLLHPPGTPSGAPFPLLPHLTGHPSPPKPSLRCSPSPGGPIGFGLVHQRCFPNRIFSRQLP